MGVGSRHPHKMGLERAAIWSSLLQVASSVPPTEAGQQPGHLQTGMLLSPLSAQQPQRRQRLLPSQRSKWLQRRPRRRPTRRRPLFFRGTVLNLRTTAQQKCGAVPRRARV